MSIANERANAINAELHRNIKDGKEYEHLMPYSDCSSVKLAEGDTKVAIDNMAYWSKKYQHHTKKLAVTFANKGLKDICEAIHYYLYWHYQYKIDGETQNLYSPACAWLKRKDGIDCKSYSIIASTILSNLGIKHYFRRIKNSPNEGYSHVYVNVPFNQKNPRNLKDGYYTIDGTLQYTSEPLFYKKDDVFMDVKEAELPIYGLAGLRKNNEVSSSLMRDTNSFALAGGGATPWGAIISQAAQDLKPITEAVIGGLMDAIQGCSDADYQLPVVKLRIERDLKNVLQKKLADLEDAILWGNRNRIQHLFNFLFKDFDLGIAHLRSETAYSQLDDCIADTLTTALKYIEQLKQIIDTYFDNFIKSYNRYKVDVFYKSAITNERTLYLVVDQDASPISAEYRYIVIREEDNKYGINPVLPFGRANETFEGTSNKWLTENLHHLKITYKDGREEQYKEEILPYIEKVKELRKQYYLGGEALYYLEQPAQREMYKIWLKYDDRYTQFLKEEAQSLRTANELAMRDYQERFTKEVEMDKEAKKRKAFKRNLGFGALAFTGFLVVKK